MIRTAICDDSFQVCSQLEGYIERWKEGHRLKVRISDTGKEFEGAPKERHYDLIFLNIVTGNRSGIELGRFIWEELGNGASMVAYMSACENEYALGLFQFQSFYLLKKPIRPEDFQNVFYKACEEVEGNAGVFKFKSSRTAYRVSSRDILYFGGDNRWVKIVTTSYTYHCYFTLGNLFSKVNMERISLIWPHKSYAVNLGYVATFSVRMVASFGGSEFTISAPFKRNALRRYEGYISRTEMGPGDKFGE